MIGSNLGVPIVEGFIKSALAHVTPQQPFELSPIPLETLLVDQDTAKELQCAVSIMLFELKNIKM